MQSRHSNEKVSTTNLYYKFIHQDGDSSQADDSSVYITK